MKKSTIKKNTKRQTLADKYRIQKNVKNHIRKVKKESRKARALGIAPSYNPKLQSFLIFILIRKISSMI